MKRLISVIIFIISLTLRHGDATGTLYMKLFYFSNPKGLGANGHICEGKNYLKIFVKNECDHFFDICINSPGGRSVCDMGARQTPHTKNKKSIKFSNKIGSMRNPLSFPFRKNNLDIEIKVYDYDRDNTHDRVGSFLTDIRNLPVGKNGTEPKPIFRSLTQGSRNKLVFQFYLWAVCDKNYYGENCGVKCVPQNSTTLGHYRCNPETGEKICFKGYTGDRCLKKNFCSSKPCKNGGTCINTANSFGCICPAGYYGRFCHEIHHSCKTRKVCKNSGKCITSKNKAFCQCQLGFIGQFCEVDVNECSQEQAACQHNGTCINTIGSFKCECKSGYFGARCEISNNSSSTYISQNRRAESHNLQKLQIREEPNWPYYVAAGAGLVAVICIALLVTSYQRRKDLIKERNGQAIVYRAAAQRPCAEENVYIGDNESDGTLYEDIDRQLEAAEAGEIDDCCPESDFANQSYGVSYSSETRDADKEIKK